MEKNDLLSEKEYLQIQLDDISKKKEQLKKENQKLKKQKNLNQKIMTNQSISLKK